MSDTANDRYEPIPEAWQHALDDLWGCIGRAEMEHLQPETVQLAKQNHEALWHNHDEPRAAASAGGAMRPAHSAEPDRSEACRFCAADADLLTFCSHSPAEVALAEAIGRAVHGGTYTDEHGAFFLWAEDPANVIVCLGEQPTWTVTTNPQGYDMTLVVNGVTFAVDPGEEGPGIARPQPPAFVCAHCGESWAETAEVGCHVLRWDRAGVEVECNECYEVQTVPAWWEAVDA